MTGAATLVCAAITASLGSAPAAPAAGPGGPLLNVELRGILRDRHLVTVAYAVARARDSDGAVLLVVDSPGGSRRVSLLLQRLVHFSPVPVVAYIPPGGRALGGAALVVYSARFVAMAPDALFGSTIAHGRDITRVWGTFGQRLVAAGEESPSAARDWLLLTFAEGRVSSAQDALERGVIDAVEPDERALRATLRGKTLLAPLSPPGRPAVTLSGTARTIVPPLRYALADALERPAWAAALLVLAGIWLFGLPRVRPAGLGTGAFFGAAAAVWSVRFLPIRPEIALGLLLACVGARVAMGSAAPGRRGALLGLSAVVAGFAAHNLVGPRDERFLLDPDVNAALLPCLGAAFAAVLLLEVVRWRAERLEVESTS